MNRGLQEEPQWLQLQLRLKPSIPNPPVSKHYGFTKPSKMSCENWGLLGFGSVQKKVLKETYNYNQKILPRKVLF